MKLKEIRALRGVNQEQLAKAIGTKYSAVSKYETGRVEIPFYRLKQIAEYLNVSTDVLTTSGDIVITSNGDIITIKEYEREQKLKNLMIRDFFKSEDILDIEEFERGLCSINREEE